MRSLRNSLFALFLASAAYCGTTTEIAQDALDTSGKISSVNSNFRGLANNKLDLYPKGVLPFTDSKYSLGAVGREWLGIYVDTVTSTSLAISTAGTSSIGGAVTFTGYWDGWISSTNTWTYISASQFSITGDQTGRFQKGDKVKLTQTTLKYFYITSVTAGTSVTTFTVTAGSDYTLANAAITSPAFSKVENPQGFPTWFNWTPTYSGQGSLTYTSTVTDFAVFKISGASVSISLRVSGTTGGTTNNVLFFTLPVNGTSSVMDGQMVVSRVFDTDNRGGYAADTGVAGKVAVGKYDNSNWGLGASRFFMVQGTYRF